MDLPDKKIFIDPVLLQIAEAVRSIRYGSVEVTIHDGRVVQIETREKTRIVQSNRRESA